MIDIIIVALVALMAFAGYRRGGIASAAAICCIVAGGGIGWLFGSIAGPRGPALGAAVAGIVAGAAFATQLERVEEWVVARMEPATRQLDRAGGAILSGLAALAIAWLFAAITTVVPTTSGLGAAVTSSRVSAVLVGVVPPSGTIAGYVLRSGLVPAADGPLVLVDEPDDAILTSQGVTAARDSVLQVVGRACRSIATGTAWVVSPGLLVTNAHVVAGMRQPYVRTAEQSIRFTTDADLTQAVESGAVGTPAQVVTFDPMNDIALLRVSSLRVVPLTFAPEPVPHATNAAIIGFPKREGLSVTPARFDRQVDWPSTDIYDREQRTVPILSLRGDVRAGNSGSPMVDAQGRVIGTVEASTVGQSVQGGFGVPNSVLRLLLPHATLPADTGPCIEEQPAG